MVTLLAALALHMPPVQADAQLDKQRTGAWLMDVPFYRSGQGMNIVPVQIGDTRTRVNLTVSKSSPTACSL
jgi:hypothetical protein